VFAKRVHDILTLASFLKNRSPEGAAVDLVAIDGSGHWGAAALAQAGDVIRCAAIDTGGFRFANVDDIHRPDFLPGGAKYFDLAGMLALAAPHPLRLYGESAEQSSLVKQTYQAAGAGGALDLDLARLGNRADRAAKWLLERQ
jgi:hypothetical protein